MIVLSALQINSYDWSRYLEEHPDGSIYNSPFMFNVWDKTPHHTPFACFAVDCQEKKIKAMLSGFVQTLKPGLFKGLSTRTIMMSSPLSDDSEALQKLLQHYIRNFQTQAVYTEIRNHFDTVEVKQAFTSNGFEWLDHLNILIDLTLSEKDLWAKVHSKRRNEIRKAQKCGLVFRQIAVEQLADAYKILQEVYRRAGLPLLPYAFFETAMHSSSAGIGMEAFGAFLEDKMVGTMITLVYKKKVIDLFAGSLSEFYHLHPNDLIPWEVMIHYKDRGFEAFDFGGAGRPGVAYGVRDYKAKFGGQVVNHGRFSMIHKPISMAIAKMGFRTLQKLRVGI